MVGFVLGQVNERHVGHAVVFVGDDFKLVGAQNFCNVVSYDFGIADFDVAHTVIVASVREKDDDGFVHFRLFSMIMSGRVFMGTKV